LIAVHGAENAVYELPAGFSPERFGEFDRFVDGDLRRDLMRVGELERSDAEHVSIHGRDFGERPIRRELGDESVNERLVFLDALHDAFRKIFFIQIRRELSHVSLEDVCRIFFSTMKIPLVEGLERERTAEVSIGHNVRRGDVSVIRVIDSRYASFFFDACCRFASFSAFRLLGLM